jgi:maltose/maltodextrin transport system substrate-binding protein/arabinogalactan oligomer/maltooligosaccharide transport system substrate-binding protein
MQKKRFILIAALLVSALLLAACPSGGGGGAAPAAPEAPTAAPEPAEAAAPTEAPAAEAAPTEAPAAEAAAPAAGGPTLTIWADEVTAPVLDSLSADFATQNGIQVVVVQKGFNDLRNDYKVAAPTGEGPDILLGAHDWLGEYIASGLVGEVSLGDKADLFAPNTVEAFTYTDGKLYGMPISSENVALYYNTEKVAEAPASWDDVRALSAELQAAGDKYGFLIQTKDPYHFYPVQTAFGGYVFGKTDAGAWNPEDIGINGEGSVAAFTWLDQMYEDGMLAPDANIDGGLLLSAFQNGDASMVISGPWALGGFRAANVPYAIAPIPAGTEAGRPFMGVRGFMINPFSKNQLLAQTFLQQIVATEDTLMQIFERDPRPSAFLPLSDLIEDEDILAFMEAGSVADPMPNIPEMNAVWQAWGDAMQLISDQKQEPQEALDNAQSQVETAIAGQ